MAPETASVSGLVGRRPSSSSSSAQPSTSNRRPQDRSALMDKDLLQRNVFVWPPIVPEDTEDSEAMDITVLRTPNRNLAASSPTPEKLSPPPSQDFCGMTATKSGSGELSLFYTLEKDGSLEGDMDKLMEISKKEGGLMALEELLKPGLAAAQVTVPHPDPFAASVSLSGFRLRHNGTDAVVTCSHFVQWPEVQEEFDKLAHWYITGKGSMAATASQGTSGISNPPPFRLQLVAVHRPWDLAIFRIVEKPPCDDRWGRVVDFHNLHFTTREDWDGLGQLDLWWSVGYNMNCKQAKFQSNWDWFWKRQTPEVRNEIIARYGFDGKSKPSNEILKPNLRTVCFGTLDEKSPTGFPEVAHQMAINLSAWHGRSGSMVCTRSPPEVRQRDDPGKSPVSICGVVAAGHARGDQNTMILFTNDMKDWFGKALEPRDDIKVNDKEFHQRFVMAP